jgi:hypothetical protein
MFQDGNLHSINQRGDSMLFHVVIEGVQGTLNNSGIQVNGHPVLKRGRTIKTLEKTRLKE